MATRAEVEQFLNQFKVKLDIWGVFFLDERTKNITTLAALDIISTQRLSVVKSIQVEDYSEGPIVDQLNGFNEMWVFGKDVNNKEIYIKIALGKPGTKTICISFHVAEYPMQYPFR